MLLIFVSEKITQIWNSTTFDQCNNVHNQCLQEIVELTFTHEVANELFAKW